MNSDSFASFLAAIRAGDEAAARQLYDRYYGSLIRQASGRLCQRLQARVSPEDVAQSCLRTLVRRLADDQFDVDGWDDFWRLMIGIVARKANNAVRFHGRLGRDVAAERAGGDDGWDVPDREPTPAEHAELSETVDRLMSQLDPDDRPVIELSLLGYTPTEIAGELRRAVRGVHRVRRTARTALELWRSQP